MPDQLSEIEREAYREYDLRGLFAEARQRVLDQYADDEITEEELDEKLNNLATNTQTAERLEEHMLTMKAQKYQKLQEEYEEDEISEEELEQRMDELFASGDDFLEEDVDEGPDMTSEAAFRLKEIGQIVGFLGVAGVAVYIFFMTKGAALLPMLVIGLIALLAYSRYKGVV